VIRVGIVQLDTSLCEYFTPVVNNFEDLKVTAVWDDGWVRAPGYAEEFAREFGVEKVCASLDELVDSVDVGMLFGQNWDLHLEQARPFLEAGKRVFIDKPVVGSMRDVVALRELSERTGVPVMGGSSLRYAPELVALRERREELGQIVSAFASGPQDFFNYGVHAVAMVAGFFGPGVEAVRYITGEAHPKLCS
jgi:predicted dehydrogenase